MLVVNVNTLLAVHGQNALRQIFLHGLDTGNAQHVMRVERTVGDGLALAHTLSLLDLQADGIRDLIELDLAVVRGDRDVAQRAAVALVDLDNTVDLGNGRHLLRLSGSKSSSTRGRPCVISSPATPPVWKVRMVSCVPGSPMDWAAMMPTASPRFTSSDVARFMP